MRILYHIPYPRGMGADRWIYEGWRDAFADMGNQVYEHTVYDELERRVRDVRPDVFWTTWHFIDVVREREILKGIRGQGVRVFMLVDWPPSRSMKEAEVVASGEVADVFFGEREADSMGGFERATGQEYHVIANAANRLIHFPTKAEEKYRYDVVYLGAYLPKKKGMFEKILFPLRERHKVGIFGPGWTVKDNVMRAVQKVSRRVRFRWGADFVNKLRVTVPAEEENVLYSSAKICVNFHERESGGAQPHHIVNQRAFKICACGGFQICDYVPGIRRYFAEDEIVLADANRPGEWFEKIEYYLSHEEERKRIQEKGTARALRDHTYHNRVEQAMEIYRGLNAPPTTVVGS